MPNRREAIQLSELEQDTLLEEARVLQVASINPDGTPHLVPMWFARDDQGLIVFTSYGRAQKIRNLERDPRLTVLAEAGDAYGELRGLSIDGVAELVRDPWVVERTMALTLAHHHGEPRPPAWDTPPSESELPPRAFKRVVVRVHPRRVRSWDHRKLD